MTDAKAKVEEVEFTKYDGKLYAEMSDVDADDRFAPQIGVNKVIIVDESTEEHGKYGI